ncbi:N-acetylmuramic acid 6-phosphate etherase [Opacimonas viscosa]|uniref:N-acetylmuramic acid 6-phosphate etherase n=1 Tax=Opacimonas viscosa TaxID=2961944 RepID=A0AA41X1T8_9ALTE|nr:N-acetylmuramic acid 6-phosphate etherase [Opacimonas viscosa]MCP3428327.1 N-acetylmuramic acid 6-phosphate etherase [Opacimonas viscosa]
MSANNLTAVDLHSILSESRNRDTMDIDQIATLDILRKINAADHVVPQAIAQVLPDIEKVVEVIVQQLQQGGRLIYIGAGTSGRLGVLDAVECRPTFSVSDNLVQGVIAGGEPALISAVEGAEDDPELALNDLTSLQLSHKDVLIGIAASGRTPYVTGAIKYAQSLGCPAFALSCNPKGSINQLADHAIAIAVGPEVLTGSTRMKAGTAQKLVLNMISTTVMIKLGKTYENLMVDVHASNKKLVARAERIVMDATACSNAEAKQALTRAEQSAKLAILLIKTELTVPEAKALLAQHHGFLRAALEAVGL